VVVLRACIHAMDGGNGGRAGQDVLCKYDRALLYGSEAGRWTNGQAGRQIDRQH